MDYSDEGSPEGAKAGLRRGGGGGGGISIGDLGQCTNGEGEVLAAGDKRAHEGSPRPGADLGKRLRYSEDDDDEDGPAAAGAGAAPDEGATEGPALGPEAGPAEEAAEGAAEEAADEPAEGPQRKPTSKPSGSWVSVDDAERDGDGDSGENGSLGN